MHGAIARLIGGSPILSDDRMIARLIGGCFHGAIARLIGGSPIPSDDRMIDRVIQVDNL